MEAYDIHSDCHRCALAYSDSSRKIVILNEVCINCDLVKATTKPLGLAVLDTVSRTK